MENIIIALRNNRGAGHIDTGVKIIIAVIIGALILGGLYALFATVILPNLNTEVEDMIDFGDDHAAVRRILDESSGTYQLQYSYDSKRWLNVQMPSYGDGASVYNLINGTVEGKTYEVALVKKGTTYYVLSSSDGVVLKEQFNFTANSVTHFYFGTSTSLPSTSGSFSGEKFVIRWHSGGSTYYTGTTLDPTKWVKPKWSELIPIY